MRRLVELLLPGGALVGAAVVVERTVSARLLDEITRGYPWVAMALAFVLAVLFHRSRVALASLAVIALAATGSRAAGPEPVQWTGALVLLLLGGLALVRDRGIRSLGSALQAAAVAAAGAAGGWMVVRHPDRVGALLAAGSISVELAAWTTLPNGVLLAAATAAGPALYASLRRRGPVERGLFWCLPAVALSLGPDASAARLFQMTAALALAAAVVESSHRMAFRDDLTGLPGRRALERDLDAMAGTWAAAMVDIDHFKKLNDTYGHAVGDQVLRMVSSRIAEAPGGAKAYRYGGEEFTLLFPGRDRSGALRHLEAVREAVAGSIFQLRGRKRPRKKPEKPDRYRRREGGSDRVAVTVSIGVADSTGARADPDAVLERADRALYRAKRAGRDRVSK